VTTLSKTLQSLLPSVTISRLEQQFFAILREIARL
jgi:predicted DNA-binding ribbon-helix-helix protein